MKIIVCTKQIRHTYARTGRSPDSNYINAEDSVHRINPHDEAALELALRLKDEDDTTRVTLLTMGPLIAPVEIRRCLAAGADDWLSINGDERSSDPLDQPDPWTKADLLARAVKEYGADLVLCGKESLDMGNGQVGALLARRLERPFVSAITDMAHDATQKRIEVQRSAGRGVREIIHCPLPAVCSVDLGPDLRFPTFERRQWAKAYAPAKLHYAHASSGQQRIAVRRFPPRPRPKCLPPPDSHMQAYDRVMELLSGSNVEKKGEMLTGDAAEQVDGIITFLKTHGFLESGRGEDHGEP